MWKKLEQQERDEEEEGLVGGCEGGENGDGGVSGRARRQVHKSTPTITFKHSQATPVHPSFKVRKLKIFFQRFYVLVFYVNHRGKRRAGERVWSTLIQQTSTDHEGETPQRPQQRNVWRKEGGREGKG